MKILVIFVGKTSDDHLDILIKKYVQRINKYATFDIVVTKELKSQNFSSVEELKKMEGSLLSKYIEPGDFIILLDEKGKEMTSIEFSKFVESQITRNIRRLIFIIGGAYGFSDEIYHRSNFLLSMSRMTFSHQMIRLFFVEQLYRAFTIMKGEPYHHAD
jgi:23S rRNA (pseudouridine1915-N3)-methyltransferase